MTRFTALALSSLLALPVAAFAADDNLLTNGSFESVALSNGSWTQVSQIAGWNASSLGVEVRNNVAGSALDGHNFIELDTTGNSAISQSFATVAGYTYTLSFSYANRPDHQGEASNGLAWSVGGLSGVVGNDTSTSWATYTTTFTGTGSAMTLAFAATGRSDSYGTSLDNVSVRVSAVPEPETYALMLAGLAGVGVMARRRAKAERA